MFTKKKMVEFFKKVFTIFMIGIVKTFEVMKLIKEKNYDLNDTVIIKSLTYYKLEFLTNDWILRTLYIVKHQISL